MRLVLASGSAARRAMLEAAGLTFAVAAPTLDEEEAKAGLVAAGFDARGVAEMLAETKAKSVAEPGALILGGDQTLERDDGTRLGKPASRAEALEQLRSLAGRTHRLHAAAAIVENGARVWGASETVSLTARRFGDAFLRDYLDREYEAVRRHVGAYRIEGLGVQLFEAIEGSHFAILGLPLLPLLAYLRERGVVPS